MIFVKKLRFTGQEINEILSEADGYIWIAVDVKKGSIAAGDELTCTLKKALLSQRSSISDIFGVGLDLTNGKIDFISQINIKYLDKKSTKFVPEEYRERINSLIRYFFLELPI
mgnify:CR=1 FL=1